MISLFLSETHVEWKSVRSVLKLRICSRDVNISLEQEVEPGMAWAGLARTLLAWQGGWHEALWRICLFKIILSFLKEAESQHCLLWLMASPAQALALGKSTPKIPWNKHPHFDDSVWGDLPCVTVNWHVGRASQPHCFPAPSGKLLRRHGILHPPYPLRPVSRSRSLPGLRCP